MSTAADTIRRVRGRSRRAPSPITPGRRARRPPRRPRASSPPHRRRGCAGPRGRRPRARRAPPRPRRLAEVLEHQRRAPDRTGRIRDPSPAMSGRGAVDRLEHARGRRPRGDVRAGRHPHPALDRRREVGEDVGEQVRGDDDVEAPGVAHHPCGECVDEHPLVRARRELGGHLLDDLVPQHVAEPRGVRLRRARQRRRGGSRRAEGVAHDPLHAGTREDARLDADLRAEGPRAPARRRPRTRPRCSRARTACRRPPGRVPRAGRGCRAAGARAARSPRGRAAAGWRGSSPRARRGPGRTGRRSRPSARRRGRAGRRGQSSGIMRPCSCQYAEPHGSSVHSSGRPSASTTRRASAVTSGPTPSPGSRAIR